MKKVKSIWIKLIVTVVSVAMMLGCFSGFAVIAETITGNDSTNGVFLHESGEIKTKVELGDLFNIPEPLGDTKVRVNNPAGKDITKQDTYEYRADSLGNYKITYYNEKDGTSYVYSINCFEEGDYFIYVQNNGAEIPTYIGINNSFKLPEWYLAKLDDDGKLVKLTERDGVKTSWKLNGVVQSEIPGASKTISKLGSQIITLIAQFDGSNKIYSQEFTIICQNNFEDKKAPTILNIANLPSSASVNTSVSLPKASADDDYDDNVLITVKVVDPKGEPVKEAQINDQGYSYGDPLSENRNFDNDRVTTFYPRQTGTYVVTYSATDDAGNVSPEHNFNINVSDRTGPVIVDVDDDAIPTVWGLNEVNNGGDNTLTGAKLDINIPLPQVVDNMDSFILDDDESEGFQGDVKMTIDVKNSNDTVAHFGALTPKDIKDGKEIDFKNGDEQYRKFFKEDTTDRDYGVKIVTDKGGRPYLKINFNDFYDGETDDNHTKAALTGDWTITFSFRDKENNGGYNNSQKVYTINVSSNIFVDSKAPVITAPTLPEYIIVGGETETYTVPQIEVSDDKDSRLTEKYELVVENGEENNTLTVEGGEELDIKDNKALGIQSEETKYYLVRKDNDDEKLELVDGGAIKISYSAKDDAGNEATLKDGEEDYQFNIYIAKSGYELGNVKFDIIDSTKESIKIKAGTDEMQYVGGFTVENATQKEFIGYELFVKDPDGNDIETVSYVSFIKNEDKESLYVKNIGFNPAASGTYEIDIRVFDAKGNSFVFAKKLEAESVNSEVETGKRNATSAWESNGTSGTSYPLRHHDYTISGDNADDYVRVYGIKGKRFALLGFDFTPFDQGYYEITEYTALKTDVSGSSDDFLTKLDKRGVDPINVTDSENTDFYVDGLIPSYVEKLDSPDRENEYEEGKYFITDPIVAYSATRNFDLTVTYIDPKGDSHTANKVFEKDNGDKVDRTFKEDQEGYEFRGRYALKLDMDGTYTLTIKANDTTEGSKKYTIKVGDIAAPQFKFKNDPKTSATVNEEFSYEVIDYENISLDKDETDSGIEVFYSLYEPGSSSAESTVSGSTTLNKLKEAKGVIKAEGYKFEKSGDYRVEVIFRDKAGNESVQRYTITVTSATNKTPQSLIMLSTVLIIVGVLLIIGVVVYLIRFRKHRS